MSYYQAKDGTIIRANSEMKVRRLFGEGVKRITRQKARNHDAKGGAIQNIVG